LPLFRQIAANSLRQLRFAGFVAGDRRLPRLAATDRRRPRLAFLRRMQLKPAVNAGEQTAAAVLRRVEATGRLSTSQYSSGSQVCHCRTRLPVRLLPS
jgi:hypothetical protein